MLNQTSNNKKNTLSNKYSDALQSLEKIFEKIKKELVLKKDLNQNNFKILEEKNQHLIHGFAWIATYVESLRQINKWANKLIFNNKIN